MSATLADRQPEDLSQGQKEALLKLLTDEDPEVYLTIREKIVASVPGAQDWLRPQLLSDDPLMRRRAGEIIRFLGAKEADNRFLAFCLNQGEDLDVEEGAWLMAQAEYPEVNVAAYQALLDSFAGDLRERINFGAEASAILATINEYLFGKLDFHGNEENYYSPENSYLNKVVDRRTGNPISLCLIYIALARRLRLPVVGIGLPGHFVARFQSSTSELYIDAFNRGKLLSKGDCIKYLVQTSHGFQEGFLAPVSPRRMLLRMCSNLHQIYSQMDAQEQASRFQHYIVALAK
jgi:regulator of sirC expression with transglutaminase-like and TPR domain